MHNSCFSFLNYFYILSAKISVPGSARWTPSRYKKSVVIRSWVIKWNLLFLHNALTRSFTFLTTEVAAILSFVELLKLRHREHQSQTHHSKTYNIIRFCSLKSDSHFPKKLCYLLQWKPFKKGEKCFLFHLKSSFRSQGIFVLSFWSCRKNGLITKLRLVSKFMTSQPG